jgi:putative transposase
VVLGGYFATLAGMRKPYPTDLSDAEWIYIEPHMPAPKGRGRPRTHDLREILNAVFYLLKSGCQWRLLPHDFPRWPTVYWYFRKWRIEGTWERINRAIRERLRVRLKRDPQPSAGVVDSQGRSRAPRWAGKPGVTTEARRSRVASATSAGGHRGFRPQSQAPQRQGDGL